MTIPAADYAVALDREACTPVPRTVLTGAGFEVECFRYRSGVEALRLRNRRGEVVLLPYQGQMVWSLRFDGVDLGMGSPFEMPRPSRDLLDTYGCFLYHSGLLRNGNPGPGDDHALHGEMPCAPMDRAWLQLGHDAQGPWLAVASEVERLRAFGDHYRATPVVRMRPHAAEIEVSMSVQNLGREPMDLMYLQHANFAFVEGGQLLQPCPYTPEHTVLRRSIPSIVRADEAYRARLDALARDPAPTAVLDAEGAFDPELVFYLRGLRAGDDGLTRLMLRRPQGDAFAVRYRQQQFPHCVRWLLRNPRAQVAAFAMPATCGVEGHAAEQAQGRVMSLAGGASAAYAATYAYLPPAEAAAEAARIVGA